MANRKMTIEESSIFIGLKRLRNELFEAHKNMEKWRQRSLGMWLLEGSARTIRYFVLAFENPENKYENLSLAIAEFAVLRADLEYAVRSNVFHFKKRKAKAGEENVAENAVSTYMVAIFDLVATIDNDMLKWKASILKGKTVCGS